MPDESGRDLLQRFVHGDRDAFEALFRQYEREAYRWIMRIVRDPAAADDALVETFWRVHRSRARFDPSRSFGAWLRRIATHAAIDQLKSASVGRVPLRDSEATRSGPAIGNSTAGPADPLLADSIARAFAALPPKLRVVATLALVEQQSLAEIADALDVPVGTVKSRLFRATQMLRKELARLGVHT